MNVVLDPGMPLMLHHCSAVLQFNEIGFVAIMHNSTNCDGRVVCIEHVGPWFAKHEVSADFCRAELRPPRSRYVLGPANQQLSTSTTHPEAVAYTRWTRSRNLVDIALTIDHLHNHAFRTRAAAECLRLLHHRSFQRRSSDSTEQLHNPPVA
jgi:hypothetical protein